MWMNGNIVRKLEQKAIGFPTASTANCLLPDHSSFILKPAPTALIFYGKRVETLVAHPLAMTFPAASRTSFVAVDVV